LLFSSSGRREKRKRRSQNAVLAAREKKRERGGSPTQGEGNSVLHSYWMKRREKERDYFDYTGEKGEKNDTKRKEALD